MAPSAELPWYREVQGNSISACLSVFLYCGLSVCPAQLLQPSFVDSTAVRNTDREPVTLLESEMLLAPARYCLGIQLCGVSCAWVLSLSLGQRVTAGLSCPYPVNQSREFLFILYIYTFYWASTGPTYPTCRLFSRVIGYECLTCMDAYVPHAFLMTAEARRRS